MDGTLLAILLLLVFATIIALIQAKKRDRCLVSFADYHATLAEKEGIIRWGQVEVYSSGVEVKYDEPLIVPEGHLEGSFIFYRDQFDSMDALYRYPGGLSDEERERRVEVIARTAKPGLRQRIWRRLRNWISMVRDALMQSVSLLIGVAKTRRPGSAVLGTHEQSLKALSGEVIGHAGNAYDPLLERHLFRQVVLEVTRGGTTRAYCGWLKDYTTQFIEVLDAYANTRAPSFKMRRFNVGDVSEQVSVELQDDRLHVTNTGENILTVHRVEAADWERGIGCILPPGRRTRIPVPAGSPPRSASVFVGTVERVDMIVPRGHAIVRHGADGTERYRKQEGPRSIMAELQEDPDSKVPLPEKSHPANDKPSKVAPEHPEAKTPL